MALQTPARRPAAVVCEDSPIQTPENRSPVAFDIPCRSPARSQVASHAKQRLEGYGERKSPVKDSVPNAILALPTAFSAERRREKARDANVKKMEKIEKIKADQEEAVQQKREAILQDLAEKQLRRESKLQGAASPKGSKAQLSYLREQESKEAQEKKEKLEEDLAQKEQNRKKISDDCMQKIQKHHQKVEVKRQLSKDLEEAAEAKHKKLEETSQKYQKAEALLNERKEKAGLHNEKVAERVREAKKGMEETKKAMEDAHSQKCQKAEALVSERKEKACQYNEKVAERVKEAQQLREERQVQAEEGIKAKLERNASKEALERKEKACQHNEKVADRVQNTQQQREERQEGIRAKWEQKKGSKVKGELFSYVSPPASPNGANAVGLSDVVLEH